MIRVQQKNTQKSFNSNSRHHFGKEITGDNLEEKNGLKESLNFKLSEKILNWKRLSYL